MPFMIDLFCGAGGVSEGAIQAGFTPIFSSDISSDVEKTYTNRHNQLGLIQGLNTYFLREDICNLTGQTIFEKINSLSAYSKPFNKGDIDLVFGGPSCFTSDTLVLTKKGYKPISKVKKGDMVISHNRNCYKVSNVINQGKKNIYKIYSPLFSSISTTENHKFYVKDKEDNYSWKTTLELKNDIIKYSLGIAIPQDFDSRFIKTLKKNIKENIIQEYHKNGIFVTSNYEMALSLQMLYASIYKIGSYIYTFTLKNEKGIKTYYLLNIRKELKVENGYLWYPISNIINKEYLENVYDITVENSHSFLANNCIVHNCQGFSLVGKRNKNDPRNTLFKEYIRVISEIQPKYAAMENVVGFNSFSFCNFEGLDGEIYPDGTKAPDILKKEFNKIGYNILDPKILCASDYGVPQNRKRVIFIAYRNDQQKPTYPSPSCDKVLTLSDGIADLNLGGITHNYQVESIYGRTPNFDTHKPIPRKKIKNNELPFHNSLIKERFSLYNEGENTSQLRERIKTQGIDISNKPNLIALFNVNNYVDIVDNFKNSKVSNDDINILLTKKNIRTRLSKDKPSNTVLTIADDYISPFSNRTFTVRELARLQSFDDSFEFLGKRTTGGAKRKIEVPQYTQVGNAVPPLLAKAIISEINKYL